MAKLLFWCWLIVLLILNVIPLGNETSHGLTGNRVVFRLDYLVHMISFIAFAWIIVLGKITKRPVFGKLEVMKFTVVVIIAASGFELVQMLLPYRAFNPQDMMFNLVGAAIGIIAIWISSRISQIRSTD